MVDRIREVSRVKEIWNSKEGNSQVSGEQSGMWGVFRVVAMVGKR